MSKMNNRKLKVSKVKRAGKTHRGQCDKVQWIRVLEEKIREKKGVLMISDNVTIDKDFPKMKKASSHIFKKSHKQEGFF